MDRRYSLRINRSEAPISPSSNSLIHPIPPLHESLLGSSTSIHEEQHQMRYSARTQEEELAMEFAKKLVLHRSSSTL